MHQLSPFSHLYSTLGVRSNSKGKMFTFSVHPEADFLWKKERYYNCHHREQNLKRILNREGEFVKRWHLFQDSGMAMA